MDQKGLLIANVYESKDEFEEVNKYMFYRCRLYRTWF